MRTPKRGTTALAPQKLIELLVLSGVLFLGLAGHSVAQEIVLDLGDEPLLSDRLIQLFVLVTVLSLVPGLAITVTCFPFMVTVFAILRQGIGLQTSPPNLLIVSLALFLTYFVMEPVFLTAWNDGVQPYSNGEMEALDALAATFAPFRQFMSARVDPDTLVQLAQHIQDADPEDPALSLLIPAFMLSEIARAFQIGFIIFLPFLVIDLVVAAILMSMGMMMVPPAVVSLPFKLAFFVVADGWSLVAGALIQNYS